VNSTLSIIKKEQIFEIMTWYKLGTNSEKVLLE